jgi:hypothetical protein
MSNLEWKRVLSKVQSERFPEVFLYRSCSPFEPANSGLCFKGEIDDSVSVIGVCTWPTTLHLRVAVFEPV